MRRFLPGAAGVCSSSSTSSLLACWSGLARLSRLTAGREGSGCPSGPSWPALGLSGASWSSSLDPSCGSPAGRQGRWWDQAQAYGVSDLLHAVNGHDGWCVCGPCCCRMHLPGVSASLKLQCEPAVWVHDALSTQQGLASQ